MAKETGRAAIPALAKLMPNQRAGDAFSDIERWERWRDSSCRCHR
jgi:hypothetical protein